MILKIFSPKNLAKLLALFAQTTASFFSNIVIPTLVFEKNANFFAENWQTSQKIVIIDPCLRKHPRPVLKTKLCSGTCKARPRLVRLRKM
jgi:hypothetical protein